MNISRRVVGFLAAVVFLSFATNASANNVYNPQDGYKSLTEEVQRLVTKKLSLTVEPRASHVRVIKLNTHATWVKLPNGNYYRDFNVYNLAANIVAEIRELRDTGHVIHFVGITSVGGDRVLDTHEIGFNLVVN